MSEAIYVLIDHSQGEIRTASLESLVIGQRMAEGSGFSLHALVLGHQVRSLAEQLAGKKVHSVVWVDDPKLRNMTRMSTVKPSARSWPRNNPISC